jgi:hypothetical protein
MTKVLTNERRIAALAGALALALTLSVTSTAMAGDADGDGIADQADNCVDISNTSQRDDDLDGYGNPCDTDLDQDCVADDDDVALIGQAWLVTGPDWTANPAGAGTVGAFDVNEDGVIGGADLSFVKGNLNGPNGYSGLACAAWCQGTSQVAAAPASCP